MMLTKEECLQALRDIEFNLPISYINSEYGLFVRRAYVNQIEILKSLIYEHFDNPPLHWEDIQVNDVIYDNELKKFIQIKEKYNFDGIKGMTFNTFGTHEVYGATFNKKRCKNERFYRKEVKE